MTAIKENNKFDKINNIEEKIHNLIFGQEEATRKIITLIMMSQYFESIRSYLVLVGNKADAESIVREVAKELNVPCIKAKYYNVDYNIVCHLLNEANGDINLAKRGIIIIEDIDDIVNNPLEARKIIDFLRTTAIIIPQEDKENDDEENDDKENDDEENEDEESEEKNLVFSTENITIIFSAMFEDVLKIRDERIKKPKYGFGPSVEKKYDFFLQKNDFLKTNSVYKYLVEFFDNMIVLDNPTPKQLSDKLKNSSFSLFSDYEKEIREMGIEFLVVDGVYDSIAKSSLSLDEKGGETDRIINSLFQDIMYDIFSNPGRYKKCHIFIDENKDIKFELS